MTGANSVHALSIDLEDYFMASAFEPAVSKAEWDFLESRVVASASKVLKILDEAQTKATFFTVGWLAERFPYLIKTVAARGHEIACHGFFHRLIYNQTPDEFEEDVRRAKQELERASGQEVVGYRAPSFSLTEETPWAWSILERNGFKYDASVLPASHARGGIKGALRFPHRRRQLVEFPMSTLHVAGVNFPFSGGGYFRLFPYPLIRYGMRTCLKEHHPAIVYLHPWEFDPAQPRLPARWPDYIKHRLNLDKTEEKFRKLLNDFRFDTVRNVLKRIGF